MTIGDVSAAAQAQHAVLAIAYAMGGSIDDMQPAYDFLLASSLKKAVWISATRP